MRQVFLTYRRFKSACCMRSQVKKRRKIITNIYRCYLLTYMVSAGNDKQKIKSEAKMPREQGYTCEICMAKLDNIDDLHKHSSTEHNASTGV